MQYLKHLKTNMEAQKHGFGRWIDYWQMTIFSKRSLVYKLYNMNFLLIMTIHVFSTGGNLSSVFAMNADKWVTSKKQTILGIIVTLQDFCLCSYILPRHTLFLLHSIPGHSQNSLIGMWSECHWWSPNRSTVFRLIVCAHQEIYRTRNISNWGNQ